MCEWVGGRELIALLLDDSAVSQLPSMFKHTPYMYVYIYIYVYVYIYVCVCTML